MNLTGMMRRFLLFLAVASGLASCTINKDIMFKTEHGYTYDIPSDTLSGEYVISPNDIFTFRLFTNDGARLIEMTAMTMESQRFFQINDMNYMVDEKGEVELPEIGKLKLAGMSVYEAESYLEGFYTELYNDPYVVIRVINNRVVVFPGTGGDARVIPITNNNTTVIEALALAGGIAKRGNASKVKLIRRLPNVEPEVYLMDLSTIEGIKYANMIVQANDIIYVEPVPEIASEVLRDLTPFVTLVTSFALLYGIIVGF